MSKVNTSTPLPQTSSAKAKFSTDLEISKVPGFKKLSTLETICEAITIVGVPRKGASYQAISKYVLSKHEDPESGRMKSQIKKALLKGIEKGVLLRPTASKDKTGVVGHFVLSKDKPSKVSKNTEKDTKKKKVRREQVSDSEATVKKPKEKKLNLSDSAIMDGKIKASKLKSNAAATKVVKNDKDKPAKAVSEKKPKEAKVAKDKPTKAPAMKTKVSKNVKQSKETEVTQPLNVPKGKGKVKNAERQDFSDSEFVVKKPNRKSLKSYSSDTEVDNGSKTTVKKRGTKALTKHGSPSKLPSKPLKAKKLYKEDKNETEGKDSTTIRGGRSRRPI